MTTATFVTGSTKFEDLPQTLKQQFTEIEKYIRKQTTLRDEIADHFKTISPKEDIDSLIQKLSTLSSNIERETNSLQNFREEVSAELKHAENAARKLPSSTNQENVYLPSAYHWEKLESFTRRMSRLKDQIEEIDEYLASIESSGVPKAEALQATLRAQYDAVVRLTAKVAVLHNSSQELRDRFIRLKGPEAKELFEERDKTSWVSFEARNKTSGVLGAPEESKEKKQNTSGNNNKNNGWGFSDSNNLFGNSSNNLFGTSSSTSDPFGFGSTSSSSGGGSGGFDWGSGFNFGSSSSNGSNGSGGNGGGGFNWGGSTSAGSSGSSNTSRSSRRRNRP